MRGMSDMGRMIIGGVSVWHAGLLIEARACESLDSGVVAATWGICSLLHGGSQCLTHVTCGMNIRIGAAVEMHQGK